ncbi:CRP-like cAMP-binding protein [Sphingomonas trueperi]|uniref:Crp/Fnr family transcriptional regulator n=1 Tax=Sphingomonas trueperi TaxID=53317 RepID=UPI0033934F2E
MDSMRASFEELLIQRFTQVAELSASELLALQRAPRSSFSLLNGKSLAGVVGSTQSRFLVLNGWLARTHCLRDGRLQIIGFYVPGDLVSAQTRLASSIETSVVAIGQTILCVAPEGGALVGAYDAIAEQDQLNVYRQVVRVGRMSAAERVQDWMIEMYDRLSQVGLAQANTFKPPIKQETLADALGLTPVHVNRTLRALREAGVMTWRSGTVRLAPAKASNQVLSVGHIPSQPPQSDGSNGVGPR